MASGSPSTSQLDGKGSCLAGPVANSFNLKVVEIDHLLKTSREHPSFVAAAAPAFFR